MPDVETPRNDLTVGKYEDVIKIIKTTTYSSSSSSKTRGGFSETGSHMLSSDGISDGAPNPWKHTVSSGNGGRSSHSCIDSVAWCTVHRQCRVEVHVANHRVGEILWGQSE